MEVKYDDHHGIHGAKTITIEGAGYNAMVERSWEELSSQRPRKYFINVNVQNRGTYKWYGSPVVSMRRTTSVSEYTDRVLGLIMDGEDYDNEGLKESNLQGPAIQIVYW